MIHNKITLNHKGTVVLKSERLMLRRFTADDSKDVYSVWLSDPEVTKYLRLCKEITPKSCDETVQKWLEKYGSEKDYYHWAIVLRETGELIGEISAHTQSEYDRIAAIGYVIGRKYWGHGYATEALKICLAYLLEKIGYNRVEASHSTNNPASGRVMQKAGMLYEGTLRQNFLCDLGFQDSCIYSILHLR